MGPICGPRHLQSWSGGTERHRGLSYGVQLCLRVPIEGDAPCKPKCRREGLSGRQHQRGDPGWDFEGECEL